MMVEPGENLSSNANLVRESFSCQFHHLLITSYFLHLFIVCMYPCVGDRQCNKKAVLCCAGSLASRLASLVRSYAVATTESLDVTFGRSLASRCDPRLIHFCNCSLLLGCCLMRGFRWQN